MRYLLLPTLAVLGCLAGCKAMARKDERPVAPSARVVQAVRAAVPPHINGRLDDPCWQDAPPVTGFLQIDSNRPAAWQNTGYVRYDDANLYIAMKCLLPPGVPPKTKQRPHDGNVFSDDVVEIMIDPGRSQTDYYQLAVNASGSRFDGVRQYGGAVCDSSWDGEWIAATHHEDGFWSVEVAVPFHLLGILPGVGSTWGINLCREGKTPVELSSIGENGAFNHANRFAVLTGLDVDFSRYLFQVGPGLTAADLSDEGTRAIFDMPVINRTGKRRTVDIAWFSVGEDGKTVQESERVTLGPGEKHTLRLDSLRMEPMFPDRTDLYMIRQKPKVRRIAVTDAVTGERLASSGVKPIYHCEAMRLDVHDPWQRDLSRTKTPCVTVDVHTHLPAAVLAGGALQVELIEPGSGNIVARRAVQAPSQVTQARFPTGQLPWGAYRVRARFADASGRERAAAGKPATVLPGGAQHVKVLNNLVSELANARERGGLGAAEIEFMNPRDGWCFFSLSGAAQMALDSQEAPLLKGGAGQPAAETMRRLSAGRHRLRVEGAPEDLIVRAVPELIFYAFPTLPSVEDFGRYDWDFLYEPVLRHCNVIVSNKDSAELRRWVDEGRKWICNATVPGTHGVLGGFSTADKVYRHWTRNPGYRLSHASGVIADEFGSVPDAQWIEWADGLRRVAASPEAKGRTFYPWCTQIFGADAVRTLMRVAVEAGWKYGYYHYPIEQPTEQDAERLIQDTLVRSARSCREESFTSPNDAIVTINYLSAPTCNANGDPNVDFKALMEIQTAALANNPACFATYGIVWYSAHYSDEECIRWGGRLFRHYAIEGRTNRLGDFPYRLTHLRNGDFEDGTEGWTVREAEPDAVRTDSMLNYGRLQGRYVTRRGDTFLVMRRSAKAPNVVSQTITDLTPGRVYSIKMISADRGNILQGKSEQKKTALSLQIDGADWVPGPRRNFQCVYASHPGCKVGKFKGGEHRAYMDYHWYTFRPKGNTAVLTISDWLRADAQGGPQGQEVIVNFIEVQPYFEE